MDDFHAVLYTAPYIPAEIQSFLWNPVESSGIRLEPTGMRLESTGMKLEST